MSANTNIFEIIDQTVEQYHMLSEGESVAVGVSGGADSMLLLSYLLQKRSKWNLDIVVANIEHGIRGQASLDDTEFVSRFCRDNDVRFECLHINAPKEAHEAGMGVEEYSRQRRYAFFESLNTDKIATAHHQSDSVETALFRLSRGTSAKGLCSIPAVRNQIIRPLIACSGKVIREACREYHIPFTVDETNADNMYARNYIRNVVIPDFERLNPSFETAVARLINSLNEDEDYLSRVVGDLYPICYDDGKLVMDELKKCHIAVLKRILLKYAAEYGITLDEIHLNEVCALVKKTGRTQLKGKVFALSDQRYLRITDCVSSDVGKAFHFETTVLTIDEFLHQRQLNEKEFLFYCDGDKISGELTVRNRQAGDEIFLAGRKVTKSLKKLYNELQIPVEERDGVPVICDASGVIGVYGYCLSEKVKTDNKTKRVLLLTIRTEDIN